MDIPTGVASHLADLTRAEKKKARAVRKGNRLARATARARAREQRHYEREGYKSVGKTRIGNLAGGTGVGGMLGPLQK